MPAASPLDSIARPVVLVPGINDSGPAHWQSRWQDAQGWPRFHPSSWYRPDLEDWVAALERETRAAGPGVLVVAHSIGCLTTATWLARGGRAAGAVLVAPPDPRAEEFPAEATGFETPPEDPINVALLVLGSSDDPYDPAGYSARAARSWGATHLDLGARGHLNTESDLGPWTEGQRLVAAFSAGLGSGPRAAPHRSSD